MPHPYALPGFDWLYCDQAGKALANGADPEPYISLVRQLEEDGKVRSRGGPSLSAPGRSPQVERASLIAYCKVQGIALGLLDPDSHEERHHRRMPGTRYQGIQEEMERQFYLTHEPGVTDPPRKEDVVAWLMERGVTEHVAKVMDTIARPDPQSEGGWTP